MDELKNKIALVTGIANKRSIAFSIAEDFARQGAKLVLTYLPTGRNNELEKMQRATSDLEPELLLPLDVKDPESCGRMIEQIRSTLGHLDILVHSIAMAKREELAGRFSDTSLDGYLLAHEVSAYSLISLVRESRTLMSGQGGSVITLSYIGSERVVFNYNVMGAAKASLEANVRYLAMELGPENIRVNAISAGPIRTLSASGIKDFLDLLHNAKSHNALKRNITAEEVAHVATFLASGASSAITGQLIHVDGGYNIYG